MLSYLTLPYLRGGRCTRQHPALRPPGGPIAHPSMLSVSGYFHRRPNSVEVSLPLASREFRSLSSSLLLSRCSADNAAWFWFFYHVRSRRLAGLCLTGLVSVEFCIEMIVMINKTNIVTALAFHQCLTS